MGLHCIGVHILLHAVGGDHCYENGLSGSGLTDEGSDLIPEFLIIILVDDVWLGRPLHLADVDGVVPAVDEQVNLSPSLSRSQIFESERQAHCLVITPAMPSAALICPTC